MKKQTLGNKIAALRRECGMTQLELADKMGVTDKAVSKWERDLSCPDVNSIPRLAEIFGVSCDELMMEKPTAEIKMGGKIKEIVNLALKAVALAMGVAVAVLGAIGEIDTSSAVTMLAIGVACLAVNALD